MRRAVSALLPNPLCPRVATPSKSPIDPSATQISAPAAWLAMAPSRPGPIAQLSRLNDARPQAAK